MNALVTITHRTVEHNDPDAAGFEDGYWWTVTIPQLGPDGADIFIESARGELEQAHDQAVEIAVNYLDQAGLDVSRIKVVQETDLMSRGDDEKRVRALVKANAKALALAT